MPRLLDLLPYVLEPHGPGSRLTVMKDPARSRHGTRSVMTAFSIRRLTSLITWSALRQMICRHPAVPFWCSIPHAALGSTSSRCSGTLSLHVTSSAGLRGPAPAWDRYQRSLSGVVRLRPPELLPEKRFRPGYHPVVCMAGHSSEPRRVGFAQGQNQPRHTSRREFGAT